MTPRCACAATEAAARPEQVPQSAAPARRPESSVTTRPRDEAMDVRAAADEHLGDEVGREEAMLDHPGNSGESRRELSGVVDWSEIIGDETAVRTGRRLSERDRGECAQGGVAAVRKQLERHRRR